MLYAIVRPLGTRLIEAHDTRLRGRAIHEAAPGDEGNAVPIDEAGVPGSRGRHRSRRPQSSYGQCSDGGDDTLDLVGRAVRTTADAQPSTTPAPATTQAPTCTSGPSTAAPSPAAPDTPSTSAPTPPSSTPTAPAPTVPALTGTTPPAGS